MRRSVSTVEDPDIPDFSDASASFVCPFPSGKLGFQQNLVTRGHEAEFVFETTKIMNQNCHKGSRIEQAYFVFETTASQKS